VNALSGNAVDGAWQVQYLMGWPLRVTQVRGLFADAWRLRANRGI
jgi:hypothetical protein